MIGADIEHPCLHVPRFHEEGQAPFCPVPSLHVEERVGGQVHQVVIHVDAGQTYVPVMVPGLQVRSHRIDQFEILVQAAPGAIKRRLVLL